MKPMRILGIVVAATLVASALVGAGTAAAVQICVSGTGDGKCSTAGTEKELAQNGQVSGNASDFVLTNSLVNITCANSFISVKMTSANTVTPLSGEVTALSVSSCKAGSTECTVANVKNLPYPASLTSTILTVSDPVEIVFLFKCGFLVNCEFAAKQLGLAVSHSASGATLYASNQSVSAAGGLCPSKNNLDVTYTLSGVTIV